MARDENTYAAALAAGRRQGALEAALGSLANEPVTRADDATAIADFLDRERDWLASESGSPSPLATMCGLFQLVESEDAYLVLLQRGLPALRAIHDSWAAREGRIGERSEDFLFLIKVFSLYGQAEDLPRLIDAIRYEALSDSELWGPIFAIFHQKHPLRDALFDALSDSLPGGLAGGCLLDAANARSREQGGAHPFDTAAGHARLEDYLRIGKEEGYPFAPSAAAALAFITDPPREALLAMGLDHADDRVQLEAARSAASLGSQAGIDFLARACLDWRWSPVAIEALTALDELNAIPARSKNPEFVALAEMARWLAHPMEFGRPPDDVALFDHRVLIWPPAQERRDLFLVRYRYGTGAESQTGVGLVGSITFVLFGETNTEMPAEEIYALHCCWEMEVDEDLPSPAERSVAAGRELLRRVGNRAFS